MIFSVSFRLFIVFSCWFVLVFPSIIIATYQPYTLSYLETLSSGGTAPYAPVYDNVRGDLYVGLNSNTLRKYTGGIGTPTTVVSTCNARPFISPVNPNDMVIACNGQGTIKYVDLSVGFGTVVSLTGGTPWKAAFASNGDLFMTATSNTILKWTRSGGFSGAGTAVSNGGTCQGAVGISIFLSNNNVYAACATNNAIKVSTGAGTGAWTALSGTCSTNEVEVQQSTGDVFAACATDATHPLRKWVAGTGAGIDFESPTCTNIQGIHIAFNGDIFISCQNENSVVRFINGNSPGVALGTSCGGAAGLIATPIALPKLFCTAISANQIIVFSSAAVVGDPQFIGFHSQRYQVHGSPNRVYSIITAKEMQFNARFAFIGKGKTHLKKKQMKLYQKRSDQNNDNDNHNSNNNYNNNNGIEKYQSNTTINSIVSTQSWTHSGNYLSSAIIKIRSIINNNNNILTLFLQTGPWETGFKTVTINGQPLNIGEEIKINNNKNNCRSPSIFYRSSHSIEVSSGRFLLLLTNADEFLNVDGAQFNQGGCGEAKIEVTNDNHKKKEEEEDDEAVMNKLSVHGLLGHTAQLISKDDNDSNHHDHHHYRNNNNDDDDTMNTNKADDWHVPGLIEDYEEENNQLEGDRFTVNKF